MNELFNFDNIGAKIKNFAKWSCWIEIVLVWLAASIAFFDLISDDLTMDLCWIPLVSAVVCPFIIYINSWLLYAFGEAVENLSNINNVVQKKTNSQNDNNQLQVTTTDSDENDNAEFVCPQCGKDVNYGDSQCICGQKFDWSKL